MKQGAASKLTERQRSVMERIDRRVPIKVIAQEMRISETRINQHIRALKDVYGACSLNELVEIYRSTQSARPRSVADFGVGPIPTESHEQAARRVAYAGIEAQRLNPARTQWAKKGSLQSDRRVDARAAIFLRMTMIMIIGTVLLASLLLTYSAGQILTEASNTSASTIAMADPAKTGAFRA